MSSQTFARHLHDEHKNILVLMPSNPTLPKQNWTVKRISGNKFGSTTLKILWPDGRSANSTMAINSVSAIVIYKITLTNIKCPLRAEISSFSLWFRHDMSDLRLEAKFASLPVCRFLLKVLWIKVIVCLEPNCHVSWNFWILQTYRFEYHKCCRYDKTDFYHGSSVSTKQFWKYVLRYKFVWKIRAA
jgi:hypothetical protein